jgi:hypothetical protein
MGFILVARNIGTYLYTHTMTSLILQLGNLHGRDCVDKLGSGCYNRMDSRRPRRADVRVNTVTKAHCSVNGGGRGKVY